MDRIAIQPELGNIEAMPTVSGRHPVEDATDEVGKALAEGSSVLRHVGHNVMFAMHAIKGFRMLRETATLEGVEGSNAIIRYSGFGQGIADHLLTFGQSMVELVDGQKLAGVNFER